MDTARELSGGNNDRRHVEKKCNESTGNPDEVVEGIINKIQAGVGEEKEGNLEQIHLFPEEDLDVENLEVPENDT